MRVLIAVTGGFAGTTLTYESAVPGALSTMPAAG